MAPLELEAFNPSLGKYVKVGEVKPIDPPGSISDNTPQGRQVYLFSCKDDDSGSTIYRSEFGMDIDLSDIARLVSNLTGFETVKELSKGENFEMSVKTDRNPEEPRKIRFTHK